MVSHRSLRKAALAFSSKPITSPEPTPSDKPDANDGSKSAEHKCREHVPARFPSITRLRFLLLNLSLNHGDSKRKGIPWVFGWPHFSVCGRAVRDVHRDALVNPAGRNGPRII